MEEGNTVDSDNPLFPLTFAKWLVSVHSSLGSGEGGITKETNYESSYNTFQELQNRLEDFKPRFSVSPFSVERNSSSSIDVKPAASLSPQGVDTILCTLSSLLLTYPFCTARNRFELQLHG